MQQVKQAFHLCGDAAIGSKKKEALLDFSRIYAWREERIIVCPFPCVNIFEGSCIWMSEWE